MIASGLTKQLWGHAILYVTTFRNRCTKSTLEKKEAHYGKSFNKVADLKFFKPFGRTNPIYIPLKNKTKLDITAERGMFIGMSEGLQCYKIYCDSTNSTGQARDATFVEEPYERLFINDVKGRIQQSSTN